MERPLNKRKTLTAKVADLEANTTRNPQNPITPSEWKLFSTKMKDLALELENNNEVILNLCDPGDVDKLLQGHIQLLARLDAVHLKLIDAQPPTPTSSNSSGSTNRNTEVKLPKIDLQTFSGEIIDWLAFHDMFQSTVHKNLDIPKAQKLTYLKSVCKGPAAKMISAMNCTDTNYDTAWKLLNDRYNNEREIAFSVLHRLTSQGNVTPESSSSLRSLIDISKECICSLENVGIVLTTWDPILIFLIMQKLDAATRQLYELSLSTTTLPVLQAFFDFLEVRARALAAGTMSKSNNTNYSNNRGSNGKGTKDKIQTNHVEVSSCKLCKESHLLFMCDKFKSLTVSERRDTVQKLGLCFNCLRPGHSSNNCRSERRCFHCKKNHHSLIHVQPHQDKKPDPKVDDRNPARVQSSHAKHTEVPRSMLATAIIMVIDNNGVPQPCRAFLDGGSTACFISQRCVQRLGLRRYTTQAEVSGLASTPVNEVKGIVHINFQSRFCNKDISRSSSYSANALVLTKVTDKMPSLQYNSSSWTHLHNLELADPRFNEPAQVDVLLGADIFYDVLLSGKCRGPSGSPIAIESSLGWLVAGKLNLSSISQVTVNYGEADLDLHLLRFWELEAVPVTRARTKKEQEVEAHFASTHRRDSTGRFIVRLPFKSPLCQLGSSRQAAVRRLLYMERKLSTQPTRRQQYVDFMKEYLQLGHMQMITSNDVASSVSTISYLPHHAVLKDSTTSKLRVVFDASAKTSNGLSLNDVLLVGPVVQSDLLAILMRFRINLIALVADIKQMYRQILVDPSDCDYLRIVWRENPEEPIQDFRLLTVTYGTSPAPYQATRCLVQLATDEAHDLPLASAAALKDFYVDDLMSGGPTVQDTLELQQQLLQLMKRGGFELRKWCSNSTAVLEGVPPEFRASQIPLKIDTDEVIKTLGLHWNPATDTFSFKVNLSEVHTTTSKRVILSEMSRIFDPLGLLSPVTIVAKILFQELWKLAIQWDEEIPSHLYKQWCDYRGNLPFIEHITINRCIMTNNVCRLELHGFCDASERAYAAVVYLKVMQENNAPIISLISGKTRVSPLNQISLPRLELCGALVLAKLLHSISNSLNLNISAIHAWTDSTVVLGWLTMYSTGLKTFVANRVSEIQELLPIVHWHHVAGSENPADCASRGISPSELQLHPLWWQGPSWLKIEAHEYNSRSTFENYQQQAEVTSEIRTTVIKSHVATYDKSFLEDFSSLVKLKRVTAVCLRFRHNIKVRIERKRLVNQTMVNSTQSGKSPFVYVTDLNASELWHGLLCTSELNNALMCWVKLVQCTSFKNEMLSVKERDELPKGSKLQSLSPFLDESGFLRVGGRLRHSNLPYRRKHPLLLPRHHTLTKLIIDYYHHSQFHAGPQLLLSILQGWFWIVNGKDAIRHQINRCVVCTRHGAKMQQQLMGDLPAPRVNQARPFLKCGVDCAGPFVLKNGVGRTNKTIKNWLAIFVCYTTKAAHLEVVDDMTTSAFIAALRRFFARRGKSSDMYSDNGTNFVGAAREIKELIALVNSTTHNQKVHDTLANEGVQWHFNPPGAPHFGGLWEAGVKSVKYHLYRVVNPTRLTSNEFRTLTVQIESCLNSRPLFPDPTNPNDLQAITPAHFLIGDSLTSIPDRDYTEVKENRLTRWQQVQKLLQHFWRRWNNEFLSRLQQRPKWLNHRENLEVNDMVLIREENRPPLKWKLGRILQLHPGQDGNVRVVTVKTASGEGRLPIVKLCLLPIDSSHVNNSESM